MVTSQEQAVRITRARIASGKLHTGERFSSVHLPKAVRRYLKRTSQDLMSWVDDLGLLDV